MVRISQPHLNLVAGSMGIMRIILTLAFVVSLCTYHTDSQDVVGSSSCSFRGDNNNIYNFELRREVIETPCPTEILNEQLKGNREQTQELFYQLSQLQGTMIRLQESNSNLTQNVAALQRELEVTREALHLSRAGKLQECTSMLLLPSGFI